MLKLTRRPFPDESLFLIDDRGRAVAKLQILAINGGQVSIGIDAPTKLSIKRNELLSEEDVKRLERELGIG